MKQHCSIEKLAVFATIALSQSAHSAELAPTPVRDFRVVQQVDDVIFGVDRLSLELVGGGRYVYAVVLAQKLSTTSGEPSTTLWQQEYLIECLETPMLRTAVGPPVLGVALSYAPKGAPPDFSANWLNGTRNAADFACRAVKEPANARRIAEEILYGGGPNDIKALTCSLVDTISGESKSRYEVRFSDAEGIAALSSVWRRSATVTSTDIKFVLGDYMWRIDRRSGEMILGKRNFGVLSSGQCEVASTVKKF